MTNPSVLRALAQAHEDDIRRSIPRRHNVDMRAARLTGLYSLVVRRPRVRRRPLSLRVIRYPPPADQPVRQLTLPSDRSRTVQETVAGRTSSSAGGGSHTADEVLSDPGTGWRLGSVGNVPVNFRKVQREDFALLSDWFSRPHVEPWWREEYDLNSIERNYGPSVDSVDPTELFIVERDGRAVGFVQRYLFDDNPDWKRALAPAGAFDNAAGVDYLIGEETMTGNGFGPLFIAQFVETTWQRYAGATQVVAAVQQDNRRSWRALEKAGFERSWAGALDSDDQSDSGPGYVYVCRRAGFTQGEAPPSTEP